METTLTREDYSRLSYPELRELHVLIGDLLREREEDSKSELRNEFVAKAKSFGFDLAELLGSRRGRRNGGPKGSKVEAKYRDKDNPEKTWAGRGRMPKWLQERVDAGANVDDFRIG